MSSCNKSKCIISFVAVFLVLFTTDHLFHGCAWVMEQYKTLTFARETEDMQQHVWLYFARLAVLSAAISCLYKKLAKASNLVAASCTTEPAPAAEGTACATKKCCPIAKGACFGIKVGIIMGAIQASDYIWFPLPSDLASAWFVFAVIQGALVGITLAVINKKKQDCTKA